MNTTDFKVLSFNAATMALSFSEIEAILRLILLILSIGYTAKKWFFPRGNKTD
jgi:hypothetical protein